MNRYTEELLKENFSKIKFYDDVDKAIAECTDKDVIWFLRDSAYKDRYQTAQIIVLMDEETHEFWEHFIHDTEITTTYKVGQSELKIKSEGFWNGCFTINKTHVYTISYAMYERFKDFIDMLTWPMFKNIKFEDLYDKETDML